MQLSANAYPPLKSTHLSHLSRSVPCTNPQTGVRGDSQARLFSRTPMPNASRNILNPHNSAKPCRLK